MTTKQMWHMSIAVRRRLIRNGGKKGQNANTARTVEYFHHRHQEGVRGHGVRIDNSGPRGPRNREIPKDGGWGREGIRRAPGLGAGDRANPPRETRRTDKAALSAECVGILLPYSLS